MEKIIQAAQVCGTEDTLSNSKIEKKNNGFVETSGIQRRNESSNSEEEERICGICLTNFAELTSQRRTFGILDNCSHIFCWDCIDNWRNKANGIQMTQTNDTISCPYCREPSRFLYRSSRVILKDENKDLLFAEQKKEQEKSQISKEISINTDLIHTIFRQLSALDLDDFMAELRDNNRDFDRNYYQRLLEEMRRLESE